MFIKWAILGTYVKEKIEKNEKKVPNLAILRGTKKIFWRKKGRGVERTF